MFDWFLNKLLDALEPRLEKLIRAAVDEAIESATEEFETTLTDLLKKIKLPLIGGLF